MERWIASYELGGKVTFYSIMYLFILNILFYFTFFAVSLSFEYDIIVFLLI